MNDIEILKEIEELRIIYLEKKFSLSESFEETLENLLDELELNQEDYEGNEIKLSFGTFAEDLLIECYEDILYN